MGNMRRLNSGDIWPMVAILSKLGIREISRLDSVQNLLFPAAVQHREMDAVDVVSFPGQGGPQDGQESVETGKPTDMAAGISGVDAMFDIIGLLLEKLPDCRRDIYTLLSRVTGIQESEMDSLDFEVFMGMIIDFCKKEELQDFIRAASKLLK